MELRDFTFKLNYNQVVIDVCKTVLQSDDMQVVSVIATIDGDVVVKVSMPDILGIKEIMEVISTRLPIVETKVETLYE